MDKSAGIIPVAIGYVSRAVVVGGLCPSPPSTFDAANMNRANFVFIWHWQQRRRSGGGVRFIPFFLNGFSRRAPEICCAS